MFLLDYDSLKKRKKFRFFEEKEKLIKDFEQIIQYMRKVVGELEAIT